MTLTPEIRAAVIDELIERAKDIQDYSKNTIELWLRAVKTIALDTDEAKEEFMEWFYSSLIEEVFDR